MTEEPASSQVTEAISETPISSVGEGTLNIGQTNPVGHFNIVKDPTDVNLYITILSFPITENHDVPS